MDRDRRLSLTVGAFALVSLTAFAVTVLSLSAQQGVFRPRYELVAYFDNVQGLLPGAVVRLAGTSVGQVRKVKLGVRESGEPAVRVDLRIDEAVSDRITLDSTARITTVGLLGDQIVELSIGSVGGEPLRDGQEIRTIEPLNLADLVSKGEELLDTFQAIRSQGVAALGSIESLARNMDATVVDFQAGMGGRKLAEAVGTFSEIATEIREGDGFLHKLVYEPSEGTAIRDLDRSLASFANIMETVETGDGFIHSLIYEEAREQDVLFQFLEAGAQLNSILGKIDRGEGTLGLLLNDPTLYEELKILVGGAGRSTVVRTLIDMATPEDGT
ncbi:MAG: MlaD family protein [Myxococcota bacterium]|nr:MlaD family protein [Myxococcota bacterium]